MLELCATHNTQSSQSESVCGSCVLIVTSARKLSLKRKHTGLLNIRMKMCFGLSIESQATLAMVVLMLF